MMLTSDLYTYLCAHTYRYIQVNTHTQIKKEREVEAGRARGGSWLQEDSFSLSLWAPATHWVCSPLAVPALSESSPYWREHPRISPLGHTGKIFLTRVDMKNSSLVWSVHFHFNRIFFETHLLNDDLKLRGGPVGPLVWVPVMEDRSCHPLRWVSAGRYYGVAGGLCYKAFHHPLNNVGDMISPEREGDETGPGGGK